jgi:hypothetical protein
MSSVKNEKPESVQVVRQTIKPSNMQFATYTIKGNAPLVIHRFSVKTRQEMLAKMIAGGTTRSKKPVREPLDVNKACDEARYIHKDGWDGFNAASIRKACISACRLVNMKMTLAKMCIFVKQDGWDQFEPTIPLIRIFGKHRVLEAMARVSTGEAYVCIRPCYDEWSAKVTIKFDADQFALQDVTNLLARVGEQVGIGEGRPDSKNSAGMGWGTFDIVESKGGKE